MKQIWKFELQETDDQVIYMPTGAEILTVQVQREIPCIWALVDPSQEMEQRFIELYGTGHSMDDNNAYYLGTIQLRNGNFVLHVFERLRGYFNKET